MEPTDKMDAGLAETLAHCIEQANGIAATTAGAAGTHGDDSGALQMCNSMASDIGINLEMILASLTQPTNEPSEYRRGLEDDVTAAIIETGLLGGDEARDAARAAIRATADRITQLEQKLTVARQWLGHAPCKRTDDLGDDIDALLQQGKRG